MGGGGQLGELGCVGCGAGHDEVLDGVARMASPGEEVVDVGVGHLGDPRPGVEAPPVLQVQEGDAEPDNPEPVTAEEERLEAPGGVGDLWVEPQTRSTHGAGRAGGADPPAG